MTRQGRKDSHSTLSIKQISDDIAHYDNTVRVVQHQNRNINVDTDLSRLVPIHALCQTFLVTYFDDGYWSCLAKHCNCTPGLIYLSIIASLILTSYNLQGFNLGGRHTLSPSWWYVPPYPWILFLCVSQYGGYKTSRLPPPLSSPNPKESLESGYPNCNMSTLKAWLVLLLQGGVRQGWDHSWLRCSTNNVNDLIRRKCT